MEGILLYFSLSDTWCTVWQIICCKIYYVYFGLDLGSTYYQQTIYLYETQPSFTLYRNHQNFY
jgi:hypothetical protein